VETEVGDVETKDDEWAAAKDKIAKCRKQKVLEWIATAEEVGKQDKN